MKTKEWIFGFIFIFISFFGFSQKIYISKYQYEADKIVFVTINKEEAEILVFKIDNKYEAGKEFTSGVWYFTTDKYNCDYKVYFTTDKYASDAKIFYVKDKFSAGLQK